MVAPPLPLLCVSLARALVKLDFKVTGMLQNNVLAKSSVTSFALYSNIHRFRELDLDVFGGNTMEPTISIKPLGVQGIGERKAADAFWEGQGLG